MHLLAEYECENHVTGTELKGILGQLVDAIGMTPVGEPVINDFSNYVEGPSGIQLLAESHVSIHYMMTRRQVWIDVFSCRAFDWGRVLEIIPELIPYLGHRIDAQLLDRGSLDEDFMRYQRIGGDRTARIDLRPWKWFR